MYSKPQSSDNSHTYPIDQSCLTTKCPTNFCKLHFSGTNTPIGTPQVYFSELLEACQQDVESYSIQLICFGIVLMALIVIVAVCYIKTMKKIP